MCVRTRVLEEEGGGSFLIRDQLVSRKWLFGTGCSAEVGMFMVLMLCEVSEKHSAHKGRRLPVTSSWVSECP